MVLHPKIGSMGNKSTAIRRLEEEADARVSVSPGEAISSGSWLFKPSVFVITWDQPPGAAPKSRQVMGGGMKFGLGFEVTSGKKSNFS